MSAEAARRTPMWTLRDVVERYASRAGSFGVPLTLSAFELGVEETQTLFNSLDEDYHISRFFHFSAREGKSYVISGSPVTHVSIDREIETIL